MLRVLVLGFTLNLLSGSVVGADQSKGALCDGVNPNTFLPNTTESIACSSKLEELFKDAGSISFKVPSKLENHFRIYEVSDGEESILCRQIATEKSAFPKQLTLSKETFGEILGVSRSCQYDNGSQCSVLFQNEKISAFIVMLDDAHTLDCMTKYWPDGKNAKAYYRYPTPGEISRILNLNPTLSSKLAYIDSLEIDKGFQKRKFFAADLSTNFRQLPVNTTLISRAPISITVDINGAILSVRVPNESSASNDVSCGLFRHGSSLKTEVVTALRILDKRDNDKYVAQSLTTGHLFDLGCDATCYKNVYADASTEHGPAYRGYTLYKGQEPNFTYSPSVRELSRFFKAFLIPDEE